MKVLLGHCFYRSSAPSGEDSAFKNEKELLLKNGAKVISYEKYNDALMDYRFTQKISTGLNYLWSKNAYQEVSNIIKNERPDVAHFHNIFPQMSTSVYQACKDNNIPVIQTLHNYRYLCPNGLFVRNGKPCEDCLHKSLFSSVIHGCYRDSRIATIPMAGMIAFNRFFNNFDNLVDAYISLTEFAKSKFVESGINAEKIQIKSNFVEDSGYSLNSVGEYIVYVGRLSKEKGVETLFAAAKNCQHIPIKVIGDGELRSKLETISIQHQLNVEFLGYQTKDKVLSQIKNSRFVVIPSECYEGFPVTIAEAFSCAKPVIGSDIGSLKEIISNGTNGYKFTTGSADALAARINLMWKETAEISRMSQLARTYYEENLSPTANAETLMSVYNSVLSH